MNACSFRDDEPGRGTELSHSRGRTDHLGFANLEGRTDQTIETDLQVSEE